MSQLLFSQCDVKVHKLLVGIHQRLNARFPFIQQSRQVSDEQNQLLWQISSETINYKILLAAMAIDTYTTHISQIFNEADSLLQTLSICLGCAQQMKIQIRSESGIKQQNSAFQNLYKSIINMTESARQFNPDSAYLQLYRSLISSQGLDIGQNIYSSLRQQNSHLKQSLRLNDQKVLDLQIKLTRILQQHQGCQNGTLQGTMRSYQLREQVQRKQEQMQRMGEQFSYEIQKYNVVYETLKKQLQEYKNYSGNVDTVELIQKLQTQIVVLREQKQREQMINDELRHRLQIVTENSYTPWQRAKISRRRDQHHTGPYYQKGDSHQLNANNYYHPSTSDCHYTDTQNDLESPQVRNSCEKRLSSLDRGYSEWTFNSNQTRNGYGY